MTRRKLATAPIYPLVALAVAFWPGVSPCSAQEAFDHGELDVLEAYEDYPEERFKSGYELLQPLADAVQPYFSFKERIRERWGVSYVVENGLIFQASPNKGGKITANNELNLIGRLRWDLSEREWIGETSLLGWYQFSHTLGTSTTSEFQAKLGVLSPLNGGDTSPGNERDLLQALFVEQLLFDDRVRIGAGKITTRTFLNLNRYAVSDREDFFSPMFVNNPVVLYTARIGIGAYAQYRADGWTLTGMFRDANANGEDALDWSSDGLEYALEFALTPKFRELGQGNYRVTFHYTERVAGTPSDWDLSFSFDQDLAERFAVLLRYAYSHEGLRTFQQRAALALRWKQPFGFEHDGFGVGAWWGHPSVGRLDEEFGLEAFWNLQLAPFLELTPDVQVVLNRAGTSSNAPVWVFGLRARVQL